MAQPRICAVSFTDPEGSRTPSTSRPRPCMKPPCSPWPEFRRAGRLEVHIGPGTRLRVAVKQPEATHEVQFGKLQEWLEAGARSPNEQVTKARLRKVLATTTACASERQVQGS